MRSILKFAYFWGLNGWNLSLPVEQFSVARCSSGMVRMMDVVSMSSKNDLRLGRLLTFLSKGKGEAKRRGNRWINCKVWDMRRFHLINLPLLSSFCKAHSLLKAATEAAHSSELLDAFEGKVMILRVKVGRCSWRGGPSWGGIKLIICNLPRSPPSACGP